MKKILITGENSYIGGMFTGWVAQWPDRYQVEEISVHGDKWKEVDFSSYDIVFHVAAIVHKKETQKNVDLYYKVNRDLAYEIALKAKEEDVNQFIFMSTMNVYGVDSGIITRETPCEPKTAYGKSKLEAEKLINDLKDDDFSVAIIRPPMVYGPNAVGNYSILSKFAKIFPFFPEVDNKRSMIYIDNLSEFIRHIADYEKYGVFTPQNAKYVKTSEMIRIISKVHKRPNYQTRIFNFLIGPLTRAGIINKVFGNLVYEKDALIGNYNVVNFEDSIYQTENQQVN